MDRMKYDAEIHHRRSIRLEGYDYSRDGAYFVTICAQDRRCVFGDVVDGKMQLNPIGKIVHEQWVAIPEYFQTVELDAYIIMPNHIHGIIIVGAPLAGALVNGALNNGALVNGVEINKIKRATARVAPTVGQIVGAYKSLCVHQVLKWIKCNSPDSKLGQLWQRNYWEHIIRHESELESIREYIRDNPARWNLDELNGKGDKMRSVGETFAE